MRYLAILAVLLFISGYWICLAVFPNNNIAFWDLRIAIYTVIFALCFIIGYQLTAGFTRAVFLVGIVFCAGDIVDRYLFDINSFHLNDLLLFLFALFYLPTAYAREISRNTR